MTALVIDGKAASAGIIARIKDETEAFLGRTGRPPGLAVVLVGADPASQVYVANKSRTAQACGFLSRQFTLPDGTSQADLLALVAALNHDTAIDGILVQLPLPRPLDAAAVLRAIAPGKDVDGLNEINVGRLVLGDLDHAFVPCTPAGCMVLLRSVASDLAGRQAVVIGRSSLVGRPIGSLLLAENCTVTAAHSRTRDLRAVCRQADILVAAVGRPELVRGDWIKPGAIVIDVGINRLPAGDGRSRLVGDVAYDEALAVAEAVTPVPGGVGPMTIAMLMDNTLTAALRASRAEGLSGSD